MLAKKILMIKPTCFGFNEETAISNKFMNNIDSKVFNKRQIQEIALCEFNNAVSKLKENGIYVEVFEDTKSPKTPDSIFPNNWFLTLPNKKMFTFPMQNITRRKERREDIIDYITKRYNYLLNKNLVSLENQNKHLEGTGVMVLDHINKKIYASLSSRCNKEAINSFEKICGYEAVVFESEDKNKNEIYHTNVLMCMGESFSIICLDSVVEKTKDKLIKQLKKNNKEIIEISYSQMSSFAGNMIQLGNINNEKIIIMSSSAKNSLSIEQLDKLKQHNDKIISIPVNMIEKVSGGSIRCMIAELF